MDAVHATTDFGVAGAWLAEYTLASVGAGVVLFDAGGHITQWDHTASDVLGIREQDLAGRTLHDDAIAACWPDGSPLTAADDPVAGVLSSGETASGLTIGVADGARPTRWFTLNLLPIFGVDHVPRAVLGSLVDVTATVDARSSAGAWQLALRTVTQASMAAVVLLDRSGDVLEWNERVLELTGRNEVDLLAARFADVCDVDVDWLWRELDAAETTGVEGVTFVTSGLGHELAVHGRFSVVEHPHYGQVVMAQLLPPDLGELRLDEDRPAPVFDMFERSVLPMLVLTESGAIVDANPAATALLERSRTSLVGDPAICHLGGLSSDDLRAAIATARTQAAPVTAGRCADRRVRDGELSVVVSTTMSDAPGALLLVQLLPDPHRQASHTE